jgi:hypothetical protein
VNGEGPKKWWPTWVAITAAMSHLLLASLGVSKFGDTLEQGLYFYGSLCGIGTAGAVILHATGRKWDGGRSRGMPPTNELVVDDHEDY